MSLMRGIARVSPDQEHAASFATEIAPLPGPSPAD
jgi:hypothetical protein